MKKLLIFCLISLTIFSSVAFAASESRINQKTSKKLEFKLTPSFDITFTGFWHKQNGFGANILSLNLALFKYRSFYFMDFGIGLAAFYETKSKWVQRGYYTLEIYPDGTMKKVFHLIFEGQVNYKDAYLTPYLKLSFLKILLNLSKNMRDTVFLDIAVFSEDFKTITGLRAGLSFSFNVFKGTKKNGGKKCENWS